MDSLEPDLVTLETHLPAYLRERHWRVVSVHDVSLDRPDFAFGVTIGFAADGTTDASRTGFAARSWQEAIRVASVSVLIDMYGVETGTAWKTCFPERET